MSNNPSWARADALATKLMPHIEYLANRWADEAAYEDMNDYAAAITAKLPADVQFDTILKRPFGFTFWLDGTKFKISCTATRYRLERRAHIAARRTDKESSPA